MRSLLTIFMVAAGGTIGGMVTGDPFYALVGGAGGIVADLILEYQFMKFINKETASEPRQPKNE